MLGNWPGLPPSGPGGNALMGVDPPVTELVAEETLLQHGICREGWIGLKIKRRIVNPELQSRVSGGEYVFFFSPTFNVNRLATY